MSDDELSEVVRLQLRCMKCKPEELEEPILCSYDKELPKYLVSGMIIGFHGSHEGHQLEVKVDGVRYFPLP